MGIFQIGCLFGLICVTLALPRTSREDKPRNFVGEASIDLTTAILQSYVDNDSNLAFSPLGYSAILAILAEGARGETRRQLVSALHLPEDNESIRSTYQTVLTQINRENKNNAPQFKNWFYVYKNHTVKDGYSKILMEYYLTEVKNVERYEAEFNLPGEPLEESKSVPTAENSKDIAQLEELKSEDEKLEKTVEEEPVKTEEVKVKPIKEDGEIMEAVETHQKSLNLGRTLYGDDDILSSLSGNSIGRKNSKDEKSVMITFNGLYYRGSWVTPFQKIEDSVDTFYNSGSEKRSVPMMQATGIFKMGSIPELDTCAIELPYQGGRYSLLILLPNSRDGLRQLVADLAGISLARIDNHLTLSPVEVTIPSFQTETTSRPLSALSKIGVKCIFGPDSDLSGISEEEDLFVQDLVQHVTVRVDEGGSSETFLTASNSKSEEMQTFTVDKPFLYFVRDTVDDIVIVAGKVINPEQPADF